MPGMMLRLSPDHPVLWLTPDSLQVGFDTPLAVIDPLPSGADSLLGVLERGVPDASPTVLATRLSLRPEMVAEILDRLAPVLVSERRPLSGRVVLVDAVDHSAATALAAQVDAMGGRAVTVPPDGPVDLAILVFRFAVQPRRCAPFLTADVPVLPVVFGEGSASVGPILGRAETSADAPCAWCLHLAALDGDDHWEIKAIQAAARPAPSLSARGVSAVAAQTATELLRWARPGPAASPRRVVIDLREHPAEMPSTVTTVSRHPRCACRALPGTATETGPPSASSPGAPTTGAGASGPV